MLVWNDAEPSISAMPSVGFYLCAGHQLLDLSGPLCAFQTARAAGGPAYDLVLVSADGGSLTGSAGVAVETVRAAGRSFDTLIVVGGDVDALQAAREVAAIGPLARSARRLASVCTGAFLLARAGLLDGRRATTHWLYARRLSEAYPKVRVTPDAIFVEDGGVWTSAGITAGIDLALALIEADAGASLAREVARYLVVYHHRAGGQSQFSALSAMAPETDRIRRVLTYARENLRESLSVERLAAEACLSERQFARLFRKETGETPAKAVERLRVEAARRRLEDSAAPIEAIAREVGFYDPERMRRAFLRLYGQPPQALRRRSA